MHRLTKAFAASLQKVWMQMKAKAEYDNMSSLNASAWELKWSHFAHMRQIADSHVLVHM